MIRSRKEGGRASTNRHSSCMRLHRENVGEDTGLSAAANPATSPRCPRPLDLWIAKTQRSRSPQRGGHPWEAAGSPPGGRLRPGTSRGHPALPRLRCLRGLCDFAPLRPRKAFCVGSRSRFGPSPDVGIGVGVQEEEMSGFAVTLPGPSPWSSKTLAFPPGLR